MHKSDWLSFANKLAEISNTLTYVLIKFKLLVLVVLKSDILSFVNKLAEISNILTLVFIKFKLLVLVVLKSDILSFPTSAVVLAILNVS